VRILDATLIRVGNEAYTRENRSYGLTTLRNRHVRFVSANRVVLSFRGKSGIEQEVTINDRQIVRHVRRCRQLPGQLLFQYLDDAGERHAVTSDMVNDYVQACCGEGFSAKDFRTWGATLLALRLLAKRPLPESPSERQYALSIKDVIAEVARVLGNTVAICRKSYINPAVFDAWRRGDLHAAVNGGASARDATRRAEACASPRRARACARLCVNVLGCPQPRTALPCEARRVVR
jgi:DNA topoisomerase IB